MPDNRPDSTVALVADDEIVSAADPLPVTGTLALGASDAEIGAVEIKDGTSDQRATVNAQGEFLVKDGGGLGALTETAPATDTASSAVNGRLQRIAQRLTSILNILTGGAVAATATLANVNDQASSATLQAANANRLGWSCFNDSTSDLYVKFGATASTTSFTVRVAANGYYEMPKPIYIGIIDGIWSADAAGAARLTELTA